MNLIDRLKKILNAPRPRGGFACRMIEESQLTEIIQTIERQEEEIKGLQVENGFLKQGDLPAKILAQFQEIARKDKLLEEARGYIEEIQTIKEESAGVAGWHLNGEIASWEELEIYPAEWIAALEEEGKK